MPRHLLILDVDETLVWSVSGPLPDGRAPDFRVGHYSVVRRPYLSEFLSAVLSGFDVAVWSSGDAPYVHGVVGHLISDISCLQFVWSADRCTRRLDPEWQTHYWVKDLKKVRRRGFPLERVLMIDDTPEKLERNYGNHICVRPFEGQEDDTELRDLLPFLDWLRTVENVRTVEKRRWRRFTPPGGE